MSIVIHEKCKKCNIKILGSIDLYRNVMSFGNIHHASIITVGNFGYLKVQNFA
jgi:hypothetical protein